MGTNLQLDVILRGGQMVDGSGEPARPADVGISGDRIAAIGDLGSAEAPEVLECSGLVVAPGFIDIHTHYDAQVFWDAEFTPSSWHGVTTVLMGNCGFSIAPTRSTQHDTIIRTLESVEGMSPTALEAGIVWDFETFAEYLQALDRRDLTLNVAAMVGHSMLRLYVMSDEAFAREANAGEVHAMQQHLRDALEAGAYGFSTSKAPSHVAFGGPVPSRRAANDEIYALAEVVRDVGKGIIQTIGGPGYEIPEFGVVAETAQRPVTWASLRTKAGSQRHWQLLEATERLQEQGLPLWPQMGCMPVVGQFTLANPYNLLESVPSFGGLSGVSKAERRAAYTDPAWRAKALDEMVANRERRPFDFAWERVFVAESSVHPELVDRSIAELCEGTSQSALDVMVALSLEEDLETRFRLAMFDYDEDVVGELLSRKSVMLGLSDGGAHASQLCDSAFTTHLLGHWVRERRQLSLEFAVWRLTGHPAEALGFVDRGFLRPGYIADVCVFDPEKIDEGRLERVHDLPAGEDRLIRRPSGVEHVLVNGRFIRRNGRAITASSPGRLLRSGS